MDLSQVSLHTHHSPFYTIAHHFNTSPTIPTSMSDSGGLHPIVEFVKLHSKGGGLGRKGIFCLRYWLDDMLMEKPRWFCLTGSASVIFVCIRSITLKDLEDKNLRTISLDDPRLQDWLIGHSGLRRLFLTMMVVGVGSDGHVYRVANRDMLTLVKLPPSWHIGMYVEAVKVFLAIRPMLQEEEEVEARARGGKRKLQEEEEVGKRKSKYNDAFMGGVPGFFVSRYHGGITRSL